MTAIKQLTKQLTKQFKLFFDLDPVDDLQMSPAEQQEFDQAVLEREIEQLQAANQIVSVQIKNPNNQAQPVQFIVGRFKSVPAHHAIFFELVDSNLIQLVYTNQIIKIAA
ncbi:hypothetical protein [Lapidilactobacillus bayanensis]|uniref:hypothetical protein n=1 Tax=Lapidilactobacillus bayanensis TaxID=2485998 RepID=UPI000F77139F|nr:hypothetical protein [Lapidilactobacillus bayanensis]